VKGPSLPFSGLNDYDPLEGRVSFHVQSYGIDVAGRGRTRSDSLGAER
jgi:hypothetical protein